MNTNSTESPPQPELSRAGLVFRCGAIVAVLIVVAALFAYVGGWFNPHAITPSSVVDTFEKVNGVHPGFRRNHAKGVCFSGYFESNGRGVELSKAAVFHPGRVPVIGRFALSGGQPYAADAMRTVRSMAVLFQLPNGEEWRTGMNNIPVFVARDAKAFLDLLTASAPDQTTGKPDPAKLDAFRKSNPESAAAMAVIAKTPVSSGFENSTYNSLNAFRFIKTNGESVPVRWAMVPVEPFVPADTTNSAASDKNFLFDSLIASIHHHPLQWRLIVTVGEPGDPTNDATVAWPPDRRQVEVGTLTINGVESEETSRARDINFDPLILPDGIAGSDDPLLSARSAAYSQSFTRRAGEPKQPSAITSAEVGK